MASKFWSEIISGGPQNCRARGAFKKENDSEEEDGVLEREG